MGCHTWLFRESKRTEPEIRALAKKAVESTSSWAEINQMQLEHGPDVFQMTEKKWLGYMKKRRHTLDFGTWKGIMELATESIGGTAHVYRGHIYEDAGFHDIFRVYGYPGNVLTSMKATKAFIRKWQREKPNYIQIFEPKDTWEGTWVQLETFWLKYPDGLIHFG